MRFGLRRVVRFLRLFFCGDPYPQTTATIARAKADQRDDRQRAGVDEDGHVRRLHGLSEIMRVHQAEVVDLDARRKQLDAIVTYRRTH